MNESRDFRRVFPWADFSDGTAVNAEPKIDISAQNQPLDLVVIRRPPGAIHLPLPDGFEDLALHNLIIFKSHQQTMDQWAINELFGHYVTYRKRTSPSLDNLLPETDYKLFAVCARLPTKLLAEVDAVRIDDGVYEFRPLGHAVRLIVANQLRLTPNNALILLFSTYEESFRYAVANYRNHSAEPSSLVRKLIDLYNTDPNMNGQFREYKE